MWQQDAHTHNNGQNLVANTVSTLIPCLWYEKYFSKECFFYFKDLLYILCSVFIYAYMPEDGTRSYYT